MVIGNWLKYQAAKIEGTDPNRVNVHIMLVTVSGIELVSIIYLLVMSVVIKYRIFLM